MRSEESMKKRRAYCRKYYRKNRAALKAWHKEYYQNYTKGQAKIAPQQIRNLGQRLAQTKAINHHDIQHMTPEKMVKAIRDIATNRIKYVNENPLT